ncbi:MAG: ribosome biogenesis GTPase [Myxococcota bacterium]
MVETRGRRVVVRDASGDRVCFLSGERAVVGDRVRWVEVRGSGGKLVGVEPRDTVLERVDSTGRVQVLAANLGGLLVVTAPSAPPFRAGLLDRYIVAARHAGLDVAVCLNKVDLGVPDEVVAELALRDEVPVLQVSASTGEGLDALALKLAEWSAERPWALTGHSGVGKTSLVAALLPEQDDVGEIGALSEHWGTGQHTTTRSRRFELTGGGSIVDSPGIRTFAPGGLTSAAVRQFFPGLGQVRCHYRDCRHRPDEEGCAASEAVPAALLASYRRMHAELVAIEERQRP